MKRKKAIRKIVELKVKQLNKYERASHLIGWWNIDTNYEEFHSLPDLLKKEIVENDEHANPLNKKYDPLILKALIYGFKGVRNEYIERELNQIADIKVKIIGKVEVLAKCPCCGYKTLEERNTHDICEVCYWEDDGTKELDIESLPNRMTLRQAKASFEEIGACEEELVQYAEKEPKLKYDR